jgi:hypothetical protein
MNIGSLITPSAMAKKSLGFEEGRLFNPSEASFCFASAEDNPLVKPGFL